MRIRYVVLSDVHFGAPDSLLSHASIEGPVGDEPVLVALAAAMSETLENFYAAQGIGPHEQEPPTLVLLGDVFDLAFSPPSDTLRSFRTFISEMYDRPRPLFGPDIVFVPGNHDHRHWQIVRDEHELAELEGTGTALRPTTGLFDAELPVAEMVTRVARAALGLGTSPTVRCAYPSFGFRHGDRWVVMDHGHFTESLYRAVSTVASTLRGRAEPTDADDLELLNGSWIDFLFSTLGARGGFGDELFTAYESLYDAGAVHSAVHLFAGRILEAVRSVAPVQGETTIPVRGATVTVRGIVEGLLDATFNRFADTERTSMASALTASGVEGVQWYLHHVVRPRLRQAGWDGSAPQELAFVFGHTHKPFQDHLVAPGFGEPVELWNTGGWVVDDPFLAAAQGVAMIVVDDAADIASIRLADSPVNGDPGRVRVVGPPAIGRPPNPLVTRLADAVDATPSWQTFSEVTARAIERQAARIRRRYFDPTTDPPLQESSR